MYFFRGGQIVKKGTYWKSEKNARIVLENEDVLPGSESVVYLKLPECYLLIPVLLFGLILSMAIPYGIGLMLFVFLCAIHKMLFSIADEFEMLGGKIFAYFITVYKPHKAFFGGISRKSKASKKKDKNESSKSDYKK